MKIRNVYKIAALLVVYVVLQSRSGGPGGVANLQVSGAPGSTGSKGTCANTGCHTAGAFDPSLSIELLNGTDPVTEYTPGQTYTLRITNNPGNGTPVRYGFQAVALNSSDTQAGDWGDVGSGKLTVTLSGRKYVEHSAPSPGNTFEMEWIAPDAGTGDVTFYSASLAANGNNATSGDGTANNSLTIAEGNINATSDSQKPLAGMRLVHNPVIDDEIRLQIESLQSGEFQLRLLDLSGNLLHKENLTLSAGLQEHVIPVASLSSGVYIAQLSGKGNLTAVRVVKI